MREDPRDDPRNVPPEEPEEIGGQQGDDDTEGGACQPVETGERTGYLLDDFYLLDHGNGIDLMDPDRIVQKAVAVFR